MQEKEDGDGQEQESTQQRVMQAECGEMNELESMCPRCQENGTTRLMITKIPHFREIIVSSFECHNSDCLERNNEILFGGEVGPKHVVFELKVEDAKDLNRQVVKSEYATITIPELQLEIPPGSQKGYLNTVEGVLATTVQGLQQEQPVRRIMHPELGQQIDDFCLRLEGYQQLKEPFTLILEDPAGNSYIESIFDYYHPTIDPRMKKIETWRTDIQRQQLGLAIDYSQGRTDEEEDQIDAGNVGDGVIELPLECPACVKSGVLRSHKCDIPFFQETLIMCFRCDYCGYKSTEIKNGGGVSPLGCKKILTVTDESDLLRDVLKSDSATVGIPEVDLELASGTLGGFFTTVEGLLAQIHDHLAGTRQIAFEQGDADPYAQTAATTVAAASSADSNNSVTPTKTTMTQFLGKLKDLQEGRAFPFTIILDDPLSNIYIQSRDNRACHGNGTLGDASKNEERGGGKEEDPKLKTIQYERTEEQDDDLGITALLAMQAEDDAQTAAGAESGKKQET